jgi:hypothetical protein
MAGNLPRWAQRVATLHLCGVRVQVFRAAKGKVPDLAGSIGAYDGTTCTVWLEEGQSETQERDTLVHELCHAFFALSGLGPTLRAFLGPEMAQRWDGDNGIEEALVSLIAPHVAVLYKDLTSHGKARKSSRAAKAKGPRVQAGRTR